MHRGGECLHMRSCLDVALWAACHDIGNAIAIPGFTNRLTGNGNMFAREHDMTLRPGLLTKLYHAKPKHCHERATMCHWCLQQG
ncbi:hypothetical protein GGP41_010474 [Bipolaris sorokiniana]|uniref:Uncharacterized protein n=1 Tax=Cochliobolus sativus TaxID=45130 RepID=A0A8H6DW98_COCSA|nr:hypothetical protein GGP41_010474 [Bipolaris sorokiniana]